MIKLLNVKAPFIITEDSLLKLAAGRLSVPRRAIREVRIAKRAIDARKKESIHAVLTLHVFLDADEHQAVLRAKDRNIRIVLPEPGLEIIKAAAKPQVRPIVVGSGPAGLFAALYLARAGLCPILLERGADLRARLEAVKLFRETGTLDTNTNIQFGEGGAGTFSDGKLTTSIRSPMVKFVTDELIRAGAPAEIAYDAKPHIGTDNLVEIVENLRGEIVRNGGEVLFGHALTDVIIKDGKIAAAVVTAEGKERELPCEKLILATGHSARDTFEMLHKRGLAMEQKPFSMGVRIEHLQAEVNNAQYGENWKALGLPAADYKLACHLTNGRGVYTFCMCPGGEVSAAASEEGRLVTNGMSFYARDGRNANSGLLVSVLPSDFEAAGPLAGIELQRKYEALAFKLGGGGYKAPVSLAGDFLKGRVSSGFGEVLPTYPLGVVFADLSECLPDYVVASLRMALPEFAKRAIFFTSPDAVMTGIESRSSSPVRILRDENCMSNIAGIYPCGEGAGYAGGIMSAAVDGLLCAEKLARTI